MKLDVKCEDLTPTPKITDLIKAFLKVGAFGFGGGVGMLAILRNEVVKKKKWISDDDLSTAVAMGQMLPGPFVPNYSQYIGYQLRGLKGAIIAGGSLLLPSFILMVGLSYLYFNFQAVPAVGQIFKGIGAVMTAIILWASYDMGRVLIKNRKEIIVFVFAFLLFVLKLDPVLSVLIAGILKIGLDHIKSKALFFAVPFFLFDFKKAVEIFWIFFKIGAVIFGGGYAAIPFIENEVCNLRPWLTTKDFLAGFALGQITPGPVAITATFVGYKAMGLIGAIIATIGIFLPSFLMLLVLIKIYSKIKRNKYVVSFFSGIKSAVVAILLYTGIVFIFMNWLSIPYAILGIGCLVVLLFLKVEPFFLVLAGVIFSFIVR